MKYLSTLLVLAILAVSNATQSAQIISANFDFGIGAANPNPPNVWDFSENSSNNTSTSQGNFTFSPAPSGPRFSGSGPKFDNTTNTRTLNAGNSTHVGYVHVAPANGTAAFVLPITASYTGPAPVDVDTGNPGYQLTLEITQVSIYGARETGGSYPATMAWQEITVGHTQGPSTAVSLQNGSGGAFYNTNSSFTQVVWNPDDYAVSLASLGTSVTRTFNLPGPDDTDFRLIDGLEVKGRVILSYNVAAVPEPTSVLLMGVGMLGMVACARRSKARV